jgi:hypothetical protein
MTVNIYEMTQTWNEGATTFAAIKMDVTDTASAADSKLLDLQVAGASKFNVGKDGTLYLGGGNVTLRPNVSGASEWVILNNGFKFIDIGGNNVWANLFNGGLALYPAGVAKSTSTANAGINLFAEADDTFAQRRGANAQIARLYNTWTDASNGEWLEFGWSGNVASIAPKANGTGTARVLHISGLPTSNPGAGILWNDSGSVVVGT